MTTDTKEKVMRFEDMPETLTPLEAFEILRISRSFGYRMIRNGELPVVRMGCGRKYVVSKVALQEMLRPKP